MTREPLDIWLYGTRTGQIRESPDGRISLTWAPDAEDRWGRGARLLSAKLTIGTKPVDALVQAYLDGLLPEGNARVNHALTAGVAPDDTYALIRTYGRDTPGAAIFVVADSDDPTQKGRYEPLTPAEVAERLRRADEHLPALPKDTVESSTLPGMVPKITLHRDGERWFACKDGAPSTWILKRAAEGGSDIVDTEVACLALARELGLTNIAAEIVDFGDVRAIAVSRYDRGHGNVRIHQEDLAQAIGLNTQDPNRKFQWGARMPSLSQAADTLSLDGGNPDRLLRLVTFSFLVGNTDMHAKNISFLRHDDGRVELSPAYDIAMHLHHPRENRRSALDINAKYLLEDLTVTDVVAEGERWGLPPRRTRRVVAQVASALEEALSSVDHRRYPGVPASAWEVIEQRTGSALRALEPSSRAEAPVTSSESNVDTAATRTTTTKSMTTESTPVNRRRGPRRTR